MGYNVNWAAGHNMRNDRTSLIRSGLQRSLITSSYHLLPSPSSKQTRMNSELSGNGKVREGVGMGFFTADTCWFYWLILTAVTDSENRSLLIVNRWTDEGSPRVCGCLFGRRNDIHTFRRILQQNGIQVFLPIYCSLLSFPVIDSVSSDLKCHTDDCFVLGMQVGHRDLPRISQWPCVSPQQIRM